MLIDWINDVLVGERIIVKDLAEDLYDGQVLQKLFGEELQTQISADSSRDLLHKFWFDPVFAFHRKAGRWEAERRWGDPVRDCPETEATDGSGEDQWRSEGLHQEHQMERWL